MGSAREGAPDCGATGVRTARCSRRAFHDLQVLRSQGRALPFPVTGGQQVPPRAAPGFAELGMPSLLPQILLPPSPACHRGFPSLPPPALLKKEFNFLHGSCSFV